MSTLSLQSPIAPGTAFVPATTRDAPRPAAPALLTPLLAPSTIAVVGASRRATHMGNQILHNLLADGFAGAVYPVNRRASAVCSVRARPSVSAIGEPIDLAIVAVPKDEVLDVAEECGAAGVKGVVVISAGFRETGAEGLERERRLLEIVRRHGMRMVGPNCMGIVNADPAVSMNATFARAMPPFGRAGFVSQSGALGLSVLDHAQEYGIGIAQFVSVGNKADVSGNDLLEQWEHDPAISVILMYVESFGNPARFLEIARRVTRSKPVIVVKAGRSRAGARAASSHTGALAASEAAVDALLAQAGVLRAASVEELFELAIAFDVPVLPRSRRTAVLTNAGGPGILAADAMEAWGLELPELDAATVTTLRTFCPPEATIRNPMDLIASATPSGYQAALGALLRDPNVDAVVPIFVPPFGVQQEAIAQAIVQATVDAPPKPVLAVLMGREGLPHGRADLQAAHVPTFLFPESAARALAALGRQAQRVAAPPHDATLLDDVDREAARAVIARARAAGRTQLGAPETTDLLHAYRVPVARACLATTADAAVAIANVLGYPVAAKVVSADVVHKTELGAVRVNIASEAALRAAYDDMLARVRAARPEARIDGVQVQEMVPAQCETIAGIARDPAFGPLVMFGLGGILVEALHDVVFRIAPLDDADAREMLSSIRAARLLDGVRGAGPVHRGALASVLRRLGQLAVDFPEIVELDVNPLAAMSDCAVAVDARATLAPVP